MFNELRYIYAYELMQVGHFWTEEPKQEWVTKFD